MMSWAFGRWARRLVTVFVVSAVAGCASSPDEDPDAVAIGLLLPFTGSQAGTASNFERAVLYARDRINAGGGVKGHHVRVISADTHSDVTRSKQSVDDLLRAGAVAVLGPESVEIAAEIKPVLDGAGVVFISPLVGSVDDDGVDCTHPWFRLAPSAKTLGEALAKEMSMRSVASAAILHSDGVYDAGLGDRVKTRFESLGGRVAFEASIDPNAQSYASTLGRALAADVGAIVLATSPRSGALAVNELGVISDTRPWWFLSPLLKTDLLVQNVAPEALEGAIGVSPKIYDTSNDFPSAFGARWQDDRPLEGAYFYYDAMALLAFALERSSLVAGKIDAGELESALLAVAGPPGEPFAWNDIEAALGRLRNGDAVYFSGLTGPMLLTSCGSRRLGTSSTWTVSGGQISEVAD